MTICGFIDCREWGITSFIHVLHLNGKVFIEEVIVLIADLIVVLCEVSFINQVLSTRRVPFKTSI